MNAISPARIVVPGIYDLSADAYHADCCEPFSLSRGIAHLMLTANPLKARHAHPKMGQASAIKVSKAMDAGSIVHSLVLGKGAEIEVLSTTYGDKHERAGQSVTDYATKAAGHERDLIREQGRIPVLAHEEAPLRACAASALAQLREHPDGSAFFEPGRSEAVVVWQEDGCWFRCMVDRLPDDPRLPPYDVKLTGLLAAPGIWDRRLQTIYAFQDAFYRRGLVAVRGVRPRPLLFPVIEMDAPYCLAMHAAAPSLQALAERQVERAIALWKRCVRDNHWPGYPPFTAWVEAKPWQLMEAEEADLRDEIMEQAA